MFQEKCLQILAGALNSFNQEKKLKTKTHGICYLRMIKERKKKEEKKILKEIIKDYKT